ncbi:MAG: hypothetical protein ACOZCL_18490 [Bacillota bacterium]
MLLYSAYRRLNDLLDKEDAFIEAFKQILEENVFTALYAIKALGIGVNVYGSNKYKRLFKNISKLIDSYEMQENEKNEWSQIVKQSSILSEVFEKFYNQKEYREANAVDKKVKLHAFLLALEIKCRVFNDIVHNSSSNKDNYPININFTKDFGDYQLRLEDMNSEQQSRLFEHFTQEVGKVISYILFYDCKNIAFKEFDCVIDVDDILASLGHFALVDRRQILFDIYQD